MIVMERLKNFFKIISINNIFIYTFEQSATSISFIEIEFVSESSQQLYHFSWQIFENFYIILTNSLQTSLDQQGRLEGVDTNDVTDSYWFTFTCRFSVKFFFLYGDKKFRQVLHFFERQKSQPAFLSPAICFQPSEACTLAIAITLYFLTDLSTQEKRYKKIVK